MLIVELDGVAVQVVEDSAAVEAICRDCRRLRDPRGRRRRRGARAALAGPQVGVRGDGPDLAELLRAGRRRAAHEAAGGAAPDRELGDEYGLRVANVFHAGDGNLHPLVLYDDRVEGEAERAEQLATAILDVCIDAGGSLTGEHGVGVDKACSMPKLFGADDLEVMLRLRARLRSGGLANPGKVFPTPRLCGEVPGPYRAHPLERAGVAERL